jgi:acetyltransferase-like isoleucine patch superfamily enzyme
MQVIHPSALLGEGCQVGYFTIISEGVELGDGVVVGNHVTIYPGTRIAAGCRIGDNSVLGKAPTAAKTSTLKLTELQPLVVGPDCMLGTGVVLYAGTTIGQECFFADGAQIRERCSLGMRVIIGRGATVEQDTTIGDYSKLQTGAYITAKSTLAENVFIAPGVVTTNDNYVGRTEERHAKIRGPHIEKGARVGGGAVLLPGVRIGQEALVAAGSVVTKDVEPYTVVVGCPARPLRPTPSEQFIYPKESADSHSPGRS